MWCGGIGFLREGGGEGNRPASQCAGRILLKLLLLPREGIGLLANALTSLSERKRDFSIIGQFIYRVVLFAKNNVPVVEISEIVVLLDIGMSDESVVNDESQFRKKSSTSSAVFSISDSSTPASLASIADRRKESL